MKQVARCVDYSSTRKNKTCYSKTSDDLQRTTPRYIAETELFITTAERTSNPTTRRQFEDLILDGRTIFKRKIKKQGVKIWIGFIWGRIWCSSGRLLGTQ
jgi:hypothetical protein